MAFDKDIQILTHNGFKFIKDLNYNYDKLYIFNKKTRRSSFEYVLKRDSIKKYERNQYSDNYLFHFENQNLDFLVTRKHPISFLSEKTKDWKTQQAQDLYASGSLMGNGWMNKSNEKQIIQMFPNKKEICDEIFYFFIYYSLCGRPIKYGCIENILNEDWIIEFNINRIEGSHFYISYILNWDFEELLHELNFDYLIDGHSFYIYGEKIRKLWKELIFAEISNRKIPICIWELSKSNIRLFLGYFVSYIWGITDLKGSKYFLNSKDYKIYFEELEVLSWMAGYRPEINDRELIIEKEPKNHKRVIQYKTEEKYDHEIYQINIDEMITIKRNNKIMWIQA